MGYFEDRDREGKIIEGVRTQVPGEVHETLQPVTEDGVSGREESFDRLCRHYKEEGKSGFVVTTNLSQEDDMDDNYAFLFNEPKAASYDRYVKTASTSSTKAMRTFVLDNICEEQKKDLERMLIDYPAMGISLGEKLLYMLGLSKTTTVRRL